MADVAAPAPAPAQTQPVSGTSLRRLHWRNRDRPAPVRDAARPDRHPGRLPHHVRGDVHSAGQHGHPRRSGDGDRDHGHRHGPDHRFAQYRPLGRIHRRPGRHVVCAAADRLAAGAGLGRQPMDVAHRAGPRSGAGGIHRRRAGLHHRLHRRAVLHRDAGRVAFSARYGLAPVKRRRHQRPADRVQEDRRRRGRIRRRLGHVASCRHRYRRHHCPDRLQPAPTPALRLPGATDVGRGPDRGRRLRSSSSASPPSPT